MKKPEEFLKQNPGSVIFARYAEHLEQEGQVEKAIEVLEKGIEANPSYAFGHSVLANILRGREIPKRVTAEFKKALELDPQSPSDMMNFGHHFLEINQPDKALPYLEIALTFEPGNSELHALREEVLDKSKSMVDLGLSDETTGALTSMFGIEEKEEQEATFEDEDASGDVDISSLMKSFREEEETAGEPEDLTVEEEQPEIETSVGQIDGEIDLEDLIEEPAAAFEMAGEAEEPVVSGEVAEENEEPAPAGEHVIEEEELSGVEDLESIMKSFGGEDIDIEEPDKGTGGEGSGELPQDVTNLLSTISDEEEPVLEIDETGDYDLSQFESEVAEDEPVLSEDERAELLSYERKEDENATIKPDTEDIDIAASGVGWESPLKDLLEGEAVSEAEEPEIPEIGNIFGDLTMEEIEVLSEQELPSGEGAHDLETEVNEGIDYSDVLAEVSDEKSPDIEEALDEAQPYDEQVDSGEEERKRLTYGDKMILDMGEVAPHDEGELPDLSMFSDTGDMESAVFDESVIGEESPGEVSDDTAIVPDMWLPGIESADERQKTVHRVEEIIKLAPDFELSIDQDDNFQVDTDVSTESVDHLLDEYLKTLTETSGESECVDVKPDIVSDREETHGRVSLSPIDEKADNAPSADLKDAADRDATATMAEIYVSQGFVSRGIDIYKILLHADPDNEQYTSRLRELESMQEQSSEGL